MSDRLISLGPQTAEIPEELLLAHARGKVLFIVGAGASKASNLPDFRELVLDVYKQIDPAIHQVLMGIPNSACNQWDAQTKGLTDSQIAEVRRFIAKDYDVALGMLERRIDGIPHRGSRMRLEIENVLNIAIKANKTSDLHKSIMKLSDRGAGVAVITTNFDLLLESAARKNNQSVDSFALGEIPRPGLKEDFSGILHIHGALKGKYTKKSELIISDQDFGEFYLRRRLVSDFIYDAARLYHLVLIGYSANDPPMRYLLNAVAADGRRFEDLKDRYTFVSDASADAAYIQDWSSRGIKPIVYSAANQHAQLSTTLGAWASLSPHVGTKNQTNAAIKRIVKETVASASGSDQTLFEHLFLRSGPSERSSLINEIGKTKCDPEWLNIASNVVLQRTRETSS